MNFYTIQYLSASQTALELEMLMLCPETEAAPCTFHAGRSDSSSQLSSSSCGLTRSALRVTRCPFADGGDAFGRRGGLTFLSFSSYVRFDIIRRILTRVFGCSVVMVMGVTDVDDKIIKRANEVSEPGLRRWCLGSQWSHLPDSLTVPTWLAGWLLCCPEGQLVTTAFRRGFPAECRPSSGPSASRYRPRSLLMDGGPKAAFGLGNHVQFHFLT